MEAKKRTEYAEHHRAERDHQGIGNRLVDSSIDEFRTVSAIECREKALG